MDKRGISAVIATVLIILITVAAVAIIWAAIIPMIKDKFNLGETCANVISSVSIGDYTCFDSEKKIAKVQVKYGADVSDISKINFLFGYLGNSKKISREVSTVSNSAQVYYFNLEQADKVSITPVIKSGNSEKECDISDSIKLIGCDLDESEIKGICNNNGVCDFGETVESCPSDCPFVFASYIPVYREDKKEIVLNESAVDDLANAGLTHIGFEFVQIPSQEVLKFINKINQKYKTYSLFNAAWYSDTSGLKAGTDDSKFLTAGCLDKNKCNYWNSSLAISPNYEGILWQNTINKIRSISEETDSDFYVFDIEIWDYPNVIEHYFTDMDIGRDCNCYLIREGIGYNNYSLAWRDKGTELKNLVSQNQEPVYFYGEMNGFYTHASWKTGEYLWNKTWMLPGTGTSNSPSLYYLPNLEIFEKNMISQDMKESIPWVSFTYSSPYSDHGQRALYYDASVSREAGRILRKAGAKGFFVFMSPLHYRINPSYPSWSYDYWLNHTKEMIAGFLEEDYIEKNKIRNSGFEAFKTEARDGNSNNYYQLEQLSPVFWQWIDTYPDNKTFSSISNESIFGLYSWKHTRLGDIGSRTIYSQNFTISQDEVGDYLFSGWVKSSVSENIKIKFYITNNWMDSLIKEINPQQSWTEYKQIIGLEAGEYKLKILIEDNTRQNIDIYFDNIRLEK